MSAQLKFKVFNQTIERIDDFHPVAKSQNYLRASFSFSSDWGDGEKIALFYDTSARTVPYSMIITDGECVVPWEAINTPGVMKISVYSGDRITTDLAEVRIFPTGYKEDSMTTSEPTADAFKTLSDRVDNVEECIGSVSNILATKFSSIAPEFDDTASYTTGQCVYKNGVLYKFTADHDAGEWTGDDIDEVVVGNAINKLEKTIDDLRYERFFKRRAKSLTFVYDSPYGIYDGLIVIVSATSDEALIVGLLHAYYSGGKRQVYAPILDNQNGNNYVTIEANSGDLDPGVTITINLPYNRDAHICFLSLHGSVSLYSYTTR